MIVQQQHFVELEGKELPDGFVELKQSLQQVVEVSRPDYFTGHGL